MHLHSPFFQGQLIEKKIRSITFIVWVLERVKKMPKKFKKFFFWNKYQSVTHVSTSNFQGLFKNIVFRSVALVIKKLWAILDFFYTLRTFYRPVPYPMHKKSSLNYYLLKVKKFHGDSVKNESVLGKKLEVMG